LTDTVSWPDNVDPVRAWIDLPDPENARSDAVDTGVLDSVVAELRRHAREQIWLPDE